MSVTLILALISCSLGLILLGKTVTKPLLLGKRIVMNSLVGLGILWGLNSLGNLIGFSIPLNFFTVSISGVLGLPGIAMLGLLQVIVK